MNPLEILDALEKSQKAEISNKSYSQQEVLDIIKKAYNGARKAFYEGEIIFELEDITGEQVEVDNQTYKVTKILGKDNKYLMLVQMLDVPEEEWTATHMQQLAKSLQETIDKTDNITGCMILPPNYDISILIGKLDTSQYAHSIFTEDELEELKQQMYRSTDNYNNYKYYNNTHLHDKFNPLYTETDMSTGYEMQEFMRKALTTGILSPETFGSMIDNNAIIKTDE